MVQLDEFLILIEFPQHLDVHMGNIQRLDLITVLLLPQNTYREFGVRSGLMTNSDQEVFVLLRVIVLQTDLQSPKTSNACAGSCAGLPTPPRCFRRLCCS